MKESKEEQDTADKLKSVLERYYQRYLDFDKAYKLQGDTRAGIAKELADSLRDKDSRSMEFQNVVKEHMLLNATHSTEVANAATKFCILAEVYQLVTGQELESDMAESFMVLKGLEFKSAFSVENGKFVKNSNAELPEIPQEEYDFLFDYFSNMFEGK